MSWSAKPFEGHVDDYRFQVSAGTMEPQPVEGDMRPAGERDPLERQRHLIRVVGPAVEKIVRALGDSTVRVEASGHVASTQGNAGDTINVRVTTIDGERRHPDEQELAFGKGA